MPAEEILVCIRIVGAYGKSRACLLDLDGDLIAEVGRRLARGRGNADVRHNVDVALCVGVDDDITETVVQAHLLSRHQRDCFLERAGKLFLWLPAPGPGPRCAEQAEQQSDDRYNTANRFPARRGAHLHSFLPDYIL